MIHNKEKFRTLFVYCSPSNLEIIKNTTERENQDYQATTTLDDRWWKL